MDGVTLAAFEKQSAELVNCRRMLQRLEAEVQRSRTEVRAELQSSLEAAQRQQEELSAALQNQSLLAAQLREKARRIEELERIVQMGGENAMMDPEVVRLDIHVIEAVALNLVVQERSGSEQPAMVESPTTTRVAKEDLMEVDEGRDDDVHEKLRRQEMTIGQLREEVEVLKTDIESKKSDIEGGAIAIQRLTESLDRLESEKAGLLQTLEALKASHEEELGKAQREASTSASELLAQAETVVELESRLTASHLQRESEKNLQTKHLSESHLQCQELQKSVDQLKADLGSEKSTVSARNEEIEKLVAHVEQLQSQISELESHQLEKSSLHREYRQLKSKDLEVEALKKMHGEREGAWINAKASLQQELQQTRQFQEIEAEQHTSQVLNLKKTIQDTERTTEKLKEQYQRVFRECEQLKEQESALNADLTECKEKIISAENLRNAQVEELEQFIKHLKGDSFVFPLSCSKKRKMISDSDEESRSDDQQQLLDLPTEQLITQHAQTVSQLRMEKKKSKQKDDYVRFIRASQQSKNDVICSLQRENCTLQQRIEDQRMTSKAMSGRIGTVQVTEGPTEMRVATIQAKLRNQVAITQQLSHQVQSLLEENARLRNDPYAGRSVSGLSGRTHRTRSIEDVQQQNVSLQRQLLEAQTTIATLKEQMPIVIESEKEEMRKAIAEEKAILENQICSLTAVLEQSNINTRDLKASVEELMQSRQRLIQDLNRDQEIADLKEKCRVAQWEREKSETTSENLKEKCRTLEKQLDATVHEKARVESEVELMRHQARDASLLLDGS